MDLLGDQALPICRGIIEAAMLDLLRNTEMKPSPLWTGHVALDIDTSPQDNSRTRKPGVGPTYKGCDGYCPILAYAGVEGFFRGSEFYIGTQHSQKGAPAFFRKQIQRLSGPGIDQVLVRLGSGMDVADTMVAIQAEADDTVISWPLGERTSSSGWIRRWCCPRAPGSA
ncbi:MAG: hypothetical protein ABSH53_24900 [Holophaga sp.]